MPRYACRCMYTCVYICIRVYSLYDVYNAYSLLLQLYMYYVIEYTIIHFVYLHCTTLLTYLHSIYCIHIHIE